MLAWFHAAGHKKREPQCDEKSSKTLSRPSETRMTSATVTVLNDERLIREGEAAVDQYNRSRDSARAQIIPMARGLLAAKLRYPATQDFGDWLNQSSYRELEYNEPGSFHRERFGMLSKNCCRVHMM
jgi:hypothetical protein